jgi:hypothetical protein
MAIPPNHMSPLRPSPMTSGPGLVEDVNVGRREPDSMAHGRHLHRLGLNDHELVRWPLALPLAAAHHDHQNGPSPVPSG